MRKNRLRWHGHMPKRHPDIVVKKEKMINIIGMRRGKGRPKKTLTETINKDLSILNLTNHMTFFFCIVSVNYISVFLLSLSLSLIISLIASCIYL